MSEARPDSAGVRLPPPLTFGGTLIATLILGHWCPLKLPTWSGVAGGILLAAGLGFAGWARLILLRRGTTVLPFRPSTALVTEGPFRFSRNPIYVGFTAIYTGISLLFRSAWPLIFLPLVIFVVHKTAIEREETYLERRFVEEYREYKKSVRRWI